MHGNVVTHGLRAATHPGTLILMGAPGDTLTTAEYVNRVDLANNESS